MTLVDLNIPLRLGRGQNDREHWAVRAKRVKREREAVRTAWLMRFSIHARIILRDAAPWFVTVTRVSPSAKGLDDHDNLRAACKAVVDQIAEELGVNDGDRSRVEWRYAQERGPWGVRIRIEAAERSNAA